MSIYCQKKPQKNSQKYRFSYVVFLLKLHIKWHLPRWAFVWLLLYHFKSVSKAFRNLDITSSMSVPANERVLSSALLIKSVSFIMKKKPHKLLLNKTVPKTDPWYTTKQNFESIFIFWVMLINICFKQALILNLVYWNIQSRSSPRDDFYHSVALLKKKPRRKCLLVKFLKIFKTAFLQHTYRSLLVRVECLNIYLI